MNVNTLYLLLAFGIPSSLVLGWWLGMSERIKIHKEVEAWVADDVNLWYRTKLKITTALLDDFHNRCQHTPDAGEFGTYVTQQVLKWKKEDSQPEGNKQ